MSDTPTIRLFSNATKFASHTSIAILAAGILTTSAEAVSIGVNFTGGSNGGAPTSLSAADVAGLAGFAQANFNNISGNSGVSLALVDSAGLPTAVTLSFSGAGTWGTGVGTGTPNQRLMNGYVDGTDNGTNTYTFNGLAPGLYTFIVYALPDSTDGRDQSIAITTGVVNSGPSIFFVNSDGGANFNANGFVQSTGAVVDGPGSVGNYVKFDSVAPDINGTVTITGVSLNFRNFSNGIQVVSVPEPTAAIALISGAGLLITWGRRRRRDIS